MRSRSFSMSSLGSVRGLRPDRLCLAAVAAGATIGRSRTGDRRRALGVGGRTALLRLRRRRRVGLVALRRRPALRPLIVRRDGGFRRIGGALRVVGPDRRLALLGPLRRRVGLLGLDRAAGVGLRGFGLRRSARSRGGGLAGGIRLLDRLLLEALLPRSDERAVEERGVLQRLHGAGR